MVEEDVATLDHLDNEGTSNEEDEEDTSLDLDREVGDGDDEVNPGKGIVGRILDAPRPLPAGTRSSNTVLVLNHPVTGAVTEGILHCNVKTVRPIPQFRDDHIIGHSFTQLLRYKIQILITRSSHQTE